MQIFSLDNKPNCLTYEKVIKVELYFVVEPFVVDTQEGARTISPDTATGWEDGYFVAYPSDGSKPYAISPTFVRDNYKPVIGG